MSEGENNDAESSVNDDQEHKDARRSYVDMIEQLDKFFLLISNRSPADINIVDTICTEILQGIGEQRDSFIGFILGGEVEGYKLAKSSVNTAILSTSIAQGLDLPYHKIGQIISGALLHDIGMLRLPPEIIDKRGGLSEDERHHMENHPLAAYNIITKELAQPDAVGNIALQHHERWDGKGYPRRTGGEAIEIGARIVSVADAFEAMVSQKSYRNPLMGYEAMKNLLADNSRRFDPNVLKTFFQTMGLYPIGSVVQLNNGAIARVVESQREAPMRPKIQIVVDSSGKTLSPDEEAVTNLLTEKGIFITKAMDAKELGPKNP